jgi:hypothetical protein
MVNAGGDLDQLQPLQTRVPVLADEDVVVHGNAERRCDLHDHFGHLDVGDTQGQYRKYWCPVSI